MAIHIFWKENVRAPWIHLGTIEPDESVVPIAAMRQIGTLSAMQIGGPVYARNLRKPKGLTLWTKRCKSFLSGWQREKRATRYQWVKTDPRQLGLFPN